MRQAEIKSVSIGGDGILDVVLSDNSGMRFNTREDLQQYASSVEADGDIALKLLFCWWLARDANMTNTNLVIGKKITFDPAAANMIRVQ